MPESFTNRLERLGQDVTRFGTHNKHHWARLLGGAHERYSDVAFLRACEEIAAGRSGREPRAPLDDAGRGRIVKTLQALRTGPQAFGTQLWIEIGEGLLENGNPR